MHRLIIFVGFVAPRVRRRRLRGDGGGRDQPAPGGQGHDKAEVAVLIGMTDDQFRDLRFNRLPSTTMASAKNWGSRSIGSISSGDGQVNVLELPNSRDASPLELLPNASLLFSRVLLNPRHCGHASAVYASSLLARLLVGRIARRVVAPLNEYHFVFYLGQPEWEGACGSPMKVSCLFLRKLHSSMCAGQYSGRLAPLRSLRPGCISARHGFDESWCTFGRAN